MIFFEIAPIHMANEAIAIIPVTQLTVGPGPILYVPVLVPGKTPPPPSICLKRMSAASKAFVRF